MLFLLRAYVSRISEPLKEILSPIAFSLLLAIVRKNESEREKGRERENDRERERRSEPAKERWRKT